MTISRQRKTTRNSNWKYFETILLSITSLIFWAGVAIWLMDGAWENGALPTHGIYHMTVGFICFLASYLGLFWLKKPPKN